MKKGIIIIAYLCISFSMHAQVSGGTKKCARIADWGSIQICLPELDGMTECYTDPVVKQVADQTEAPSNAEIGYYLTTSDFNNFGYVDTMQDYFKIYGVKSIMDLKAGTKEMGSLDAQFRSMYKSSTWEEINKKAEEQLDSISISDLVLLESFTRGKTASSYIFYSEYSTDSRTIKMVMSVTFMLVKERIICLAYYTRYRDASTQQEIRSKVENVLDEVFSANE